MNSKNKLTESDKARIWRFHKDNPLVTHTDIAAFFTIERSTVSKIVHQDQYQFSLLDEAALERTLPQVDVQSALRTWFEEKVLKGDPPTRAMVRKKAAILGASAWLQDNDGDACLPKPETSEWQNASLIGNLAPGQYYPRSESTVTVLHRHERNKSLQSNRDTIGSQPKPAGDPFSLSLAPRQEGYALRQPVASTFRGSKEASAQSSTLGSQKTSTDVSASEQTKWYIWDAFDLLRTVLVDLAEPTTSDLLCLSHLEDRLSHLAPKEHPSAEPIRRPLDFPM